MGLSPIWLLAILSLGCDHAVALKCYDCVDFYTREKESNPDCRSNTDRLTPVECQRTENVSETRVLRCFKLDGTVTASDKEKTTEVNDVLRGCDWVPSETPENQCFTTGVDGVPLDEDSFTVGSVTETFDTYTLCVCNHDSCNGVDLVRPPVCLLPFVVASAAVLTIVDSV